MQPITKNKNNKTNSSIMFLIIPSISKEISKRKRIPLTESYKIVYKSKLYKDLENEESKLWYYSCKDLTNFLLEEEKNGKFSVSEV